MLFIFISSSVFGFVPNLGYVLTLYPALMLMILTLHEKRKIQAGFKLEIFIESQLIIAGLITVLWSVL